MKNVAQIAALLKTDLESHFSTVRVSALQTNEQFLKELKAINPDKLPGVIIVFDNFNNNYTEGLTEYRFTLVAVAKFTAAGDERALAAFQAGANLIDLFPVEGRTLGGEVFIHPLDCIAASPDSQYAAMALGIVCKQGF